jgi:hypothetical protein
MSKVNRPFGLYSVRLDDGRRVVRAMIWEPLPATVWMVATGKSDALSKLRELGAIDPHLQTSIRPLSEAVDYAGSDPDGGVFCRELHPRGRIGYLPLSQLSAYLGGHSRAF